MKSYLILLPVLIFAIMQGVFLPLNLVLLVVIIWSTFKDNKRSLWVAFLSGLLLDLSWGKTLGLSSAILLGAAFLIILYKRRFDPSHFIFLPAFTFFLSVGFDYFANGRVFWLGSLLLGLFALILRLVLAPFFEELERREVKL